MKKTATRSFLPMALAFATTVASAQASHECQLVNGMRVIVKEDHRAPTVAHMVWYRAGSMDEHSGVTGVAHVLEHMMFKGTKTHKPGEFSRRVAQLGGRENAFTSTDYTAYFQQVERSRLPQMMALEADRMANLVLTEEEFAREIRVVMEERRLQTDDQPIAKLYEALHAAAYFSHPYHHPIVGWMSDLANMTVEDARRWYSRWYAPNNAVMVVAGDVEGAAVCALARRHFGAIPSRPVLSARPQEEAPQTGPRRVTVKAPAENPYIALAFKAPALRDVEKDEDPFALDVLAAVLDGYDNARLKAGLVRTERIANTASAEYANISRGSPVLFVLSGTPATGVSPEVLEKRLRDEVARIARDGVSEEELARIKTQLVADEIYKRDSAFGQAMEIGELELSGIPHTKIDRIIERLGKVSVEQVKAVAAKYFGDDNLTVATLVPLPLENRKPPSLPTRH
ncbi:M16 family metallopeptidase [Noviherbaspirillum sp. ST9]|uniref:M16 family metallopeptidase n=1 Tax=Noviherbaspirillum sp. ST9 TaxID=3401606 RepID=UPI003B586706